MFLEIFLIQYLPFSFHRLLRHHLPNFHNTKTLISLERKKIFQKGKRNSPVFWKAFQITSNYFSFHRHFKYLGNPWPGEQVKMAHVPLALGLCLQLNKEFHNWVFSLLVHVWKIATPSNWCCSRGELCDIWIWVVPCLHCESWDCLKSRLSESYPRVNKVCRSQQAIIW